MVSGECLNNDLPSIEVSKTVDHCILATEPGALAPAQGRYNEPRLAFFNVMIVTLVPITRAS
jgi:hypothetical protein